jgi:hypothetical protein
MKRLRTPKAKPGELVVAWGRVDKHETPSICYAYPDRDGKCDSRLLCDALEGPRYRPDFRNGHAGYTVEKSLMKELEERGYDLTTLRLTIRRKPPTLAPSPAGEAP